MSLILITRSKGSILKKLDKVKVANLIEPSILPFAAPMLCVKKEDGSLRVTIDFQMINKNIFDSAYPLHWLDNQINSMCGSAWFTALSLAKD